MVKSRIEDYGLCSTTSKVFGGPINNITMLGQSVEEGSYDRRCLSKFTVDFGDPTNLWGSSDALLPLSAYLRPVSSAPCSLAHCYHLNISC